MAANAIYRLLHGIGLLAAPDLCRVCGCSLTLGETYLCLDCLMGVPRTGLHKCAFNDIHRRLGHHCKVDRAAAWLEYSKESAYARLLVDAKYASLPRLARTLGRLCAAELSADGFFAGVDALAPMPMHWAKRLLRGYNQAMEIARGIADVTGLEVCDALRAVKSHGVQSRKGRSARLSNIKGTMALDPAACVAGKRVMIVDDIITTGASMAEAVAAISAGAPATVDVLSIGLTSLH